MDTKTFSKLEIGDRVVLQNSSDIYVVYGTGIYREFVKLRLTDDVESTRRIPRDQADLIELAPVDKVRETPEERGKRLGRLYKEDREGKTLETKDIKDLVKFLETLEAFMGTSDFATRALFGHTRDVRLNNEGFLRARTEN